MRQRECIAGTGASDIPAARSARALRPRILPTTANRRGEPDGHE